MKILTFWLTIFILLILIAVEVFAGGPLYTLNGKAVRYQSNIITYKLDRGAFGVFTSAQARALANASFKAWDDVATSNVTFQHTDADTLPVDVTGNNYLQYTTLTDFKYDGINPIIFDSDGAITDSLFGEGASESVIGFAGSGDSNNDGYYDEGEAVMNGVFADGSAFSYTLEEWKATFVHEFGHFLGLDHTQINGIYEGDTSKTVYIPTMYPFATANDIPLGDLNPDDIAAISTLYPEPTFATTTGKISGSVWRGGNIRVPGVNVVATSTGPDSLMNQISTVTDYYEQNTSEYAIIGLAPGSYVVRIEPIDPEFTEGSSVGPYSYDATGLSFQNPVALEYYNGANESNNPLIDDPLQKTPITVTSGITISNIHIYVNAKPTGTVLLNEQFFFSGLLTANGWTAHSGTTNFLSTTNGLSIGGSASAGSTVNAVLVSNLGGEDVNKSFVEQSGTGTTIYARMLVKVTDTAFTKTGDYFFHLGNRTSPTNFSLFSSRVFVKLTGGFVNFGISNSSTPVYSSANFDKNITYQLITQYTINTAGNDEAKLWIFTHTTTEDYAGTPAVTNSTTAGENVINAVGIRQGSGTTSVQLVLDDISINTSWPQILSVKNIPSIVPPSTIELMQNYPNPFNPTTSIRFALPTSEMVRLKVFDLLGREIAQLADGRFDMGVHEVRFDAHQLSSGTYFYSLEAGNHREIKKMILMK